MSEAARLELLEALVAGYENSRSFAECVAVTVAAESMLAGQLPVSLSSARTRCQNKLPNAGLLAGGSP
jgi:hypothetical protein